MLERKQMNKELQNNLNNSIRHYLSFSDHQIPMPNAYVLNKGDNSVLRLVLEFGITDDDKAISDVSILGNAYVCETSYYDATLCHELGHLIIYTTRPHRPTNAFLYMLTNEMAADKEGYKLFVRGSGKRRINYLALFLQNFSGSFKSMCRSRTFQQRWLHFKCLVNNTLRTAAFAYYAGKCKWPSSGQQI